MMERSTWLEFTARLSSLYPSGDTLHKTLVPLAVVVKIRDSKDGAAITVSYGREGVDTLQAAERFDKLIFRQLPP